MKRIIVSIMGLSFTLLALAQSMPFMNNYDATKFSSTELNGTARFMAVGGAMSALGGDASTLVYNPGGIGIYRSSEMTLSLNTHWTNTTMAGNAQRYVTANLSNVGYIGYWDLKKEKGLVNFNFGVAYNRMKNFDRNAAYSRNKNYSISQILAASTQGVDKVDLVSSEGYDPYNNPDIAWRSILGYCSYTFDDISDNTYTSHFDEIGRGNVSDNVYFNERGFVDEYAISLGGNVSNIFYWGMSFVCNYMDYSLKQSYYESMADQSTIELNNYYRAIGTGFTYKLGFIVKPINWLRIGASFHTPTWFAVNSYNYSDIYTKIYTGGTSANYSIQSPEEGERAYVNSPMKAIAGLGFVLGKFGFVGIDYQYANYRGMEIQSSSRMDNVTMKNIILSEMLDTHTVRLGVEIKPIEALSLRIGGGYTTPCESFNGSRLYYDNDTRTDFEYYNDNGSYNITAGVGYRIGRHAIDLAYVYQVNMANYYEFSNSSSSMYYISDLVVDPIDLRSVRNQIVLSYGIRF